MSVVPNLASVRMAVVSTRWEATAANAMTALRPAPQEQSVLTTERAIVTWKFYRPCVSSHQLTGTVLPNLSAAVTRAGVGAHSVSSAHFLEQSSTRRCAHLDLAIPLTDEILMSV